MNKFSKPIIYTLGGLSAFSNVACKKAEKKADEAAQAPNVIYVFPDQFRNSAMGFWRESPYKDSINYISDPVQTPNLDAFAKESMVLTSAMSNFPLSGPHRGCLLTGAYPNKSGVPLNPNSTRPISDLRDDITCLSDVFAASGYDCGYIGKFHANYPTPNDPENPGHYVEEKRPVWDTYTPPEKRHGFNYWYSYGTYDVHKHPHYWDKNGKKHQIDEWSPIHEAKKAIAYIQNSEGQRDSNKPFFLMIGMNPPHSPYHSLNDVMEEDYELYKDIPLDSLLVRKNAHPEMDKAKSTPFYFSSVTGVDRAFGMILEALKKAGLDKNTIVVFSSDHGETMTSQGIKDPKNSPYHEAMNVPFIVRYPGHIKPAVEKFILSTPDVMPTLLGLTGLSDKIPSTVQGENLSALFLNPEKGSINHPDFALYFQNLNGDTDEEGKFINYFPSSRGIKTKNYTLAFFIDKDKKLEKTLFFNDEKDPYQLHPLSAQDAPEIYKSLCEKMGSKLKEIDDPWYQDKILNDLIPY